MVVSPVVTSLSRNTALFPLTVGLGRFARLRPSRKSCRTTTWFALLATWSRPRTVARSPGAFLIVVGASAVPPFLILTRPR